MADNAFTKLPLAGQLGIAAAVAFAILGVFWWQYWSPKQAEYKQKSEQLDSIRKEIEALTVIANRLTEFQREVALLEAKLNTLKNILPTEKETPKLMRDVQSLASQANLTIKRFTPKAVAAKDFYQEWPIDVEVEGSYHNLGGFFDKVRLLNRLVNVGTVRISAKSQQTQSSTISAACVATTFVYVETPATPGGPPRPPGAPAPKPAGAGQ